MKGSFRESMTWLHTWSSLVVGWLLFAIFLTGTVVFFRSEINYWMAPELHVSQPGPGSAQVAYDYLARKAPEAEQWQIQLPTTRERALQVRWRNPGEPGGRRGGHSQALDASTGAELAPRDTDAANFLYRFHFQLHGIHWLPGRIIVGIASMLMFVGIITGIVAHKHIFKDFFAFRTRKSLRGLLDGHAITAVFALPFHFMITLSGLVLLAGTLVFWNNEGGRGRGAEPPPAPVQSFTPADGDLPLAAMLATTEARWQMPVRAIAIQHPLTSAAKVEVDSSYRSGVTSGRGGGASLVFNAAGEIQKENPGAWADNAIAATWNALSILHQARFAGTLLRWLFFLAGVLGCVMIATGLAYWAKKRRKQLGGRFGYELVNALNIAGVAGLCIATAGFFWANRLIPVAAEDRASLEISAFFLIWLAALAHAACLRSRRGWVHQFAVAALLYALIPLLDSLTSPVSLVGAWRQGDWLRLGFDLTCFATGVAFAVAAAILARGAVPAARVAAAPAANRGRSAPLAREGAA
ncbi:PepSY-associated TM helix domain-containing protein [Parahaliea mediterranea]|uniref:PepSY-associated TM helix domain-containing protein n=1 Tax=Parahaliea mediterranea TaxID=651086 RepID=UPI001300B21E|nr:PepSY-associated TM helix domain-containing protein [Parahaliea mediterranea]